MSKLSIHTKIYTKELADWLEENRVKNKIYSEHDNLVEIECDEKVKRSLCILFEEIVLNKNPITKGYKSIYRDVRKLVFIPHRENIYNELVEFLESNNSLNLEGYTKFRMDEYSHLVNLVLYDAVRKSF